ncbi:MAG: SRPBCC domain-containing protein [Geodermatophilaceae bacterium]|nr:SRPBCC domain-containing protein [Geodermatophilaceae bacterium]
MTSQTHTDRDSTEHGTFVVEWTYPVSPDRVFAAFEHPATKLRWSVEAKAGEVREHTLDFTVGGQEMTRFQFGGGAEITSHSTFQDIVRDKRIVWAFRMSLGSRPASAALSTVHPRPERGRDHSHLHRARCDPGGMHSLTIAEQGTGVLLQRLGEKLARWEVGLWPCSESTR